MPLSEVLQPTEDPTVSHLAKAALKLSAVGGHGVARHLMAAARRAADSTGAELPASVHGKSCAHCGSVFVPGETSRARILPSRKRRRQLKAAPGQLESKNRLVITCLLCGEQTRLAGSEPAKRKAKFKAPAQKNAAAEGKSAGGASPRSSQPAKEDGFISLSAPSRKRKKAADAAPAPTPLSHFQRFLSPI